MAKAKQANEHLGLSTIKSEAPKELLSSGETLLKLDLTKVKITDQLSHDKYVTVLQRIKQFREKWGEYWDDDISAAHGLHKSLCDKKNQLDRPAERLEKGLAGLIGAFIADVEAKEQQRRAEDQERARIAAEAQKKAEIKEAKSSGAPKAVVEAMKAEPAAIPKVEAPEIIQRAAGSAAPKRWKFELVSKITLLKYCAEHPEYAYLFDFNQGEADRLATRQKEILQQNPLPGSFVKFETGYRVKAY